MPEDIDVFAPEELMPEYPELQELALNLLTEQVDGLAMDLGGSDADEWVERQTVSLDLSELLSSDAGEVVIDSQAPLALTAHSQIKDTGFVDAHVTGDGADVSGFAYLSFESGATVYYPAGTDLVLDTVETAL